MSRRRTFHQGERVQRHAFAGTPWRCGFRGVVIGFLGRTVRVQADDGQVYDEEPSSLVPDGNPWPGAVSCTCCIASPVVVQLALFEVAA